MKECCILLYCDKAEYWSDGKPIHHYNGYFDSLKNENQFIKHYYDGNFELTHNIEDAHIFYSDKECDECMEAMVKAGAKTIPVWTYSSGSKVLRIMNMRDKWWHEECKYTGYGYLVQQPIPFNEIIKKGLNEPDAQSVHYPNLHWSVNGNLQPSLMNTTVEEWYKNHNINIE